MTTDMIHPGHSASQTPASASQVSTLVSNKSRLADTFFGPENGSNKRRCLLCLTKTVELKVNARSKTNLINHVTSFHSGEWEASRELVSEEIIKAQTDDSSHMMKLISRTAQAQFEEDFRNHIIDDQVPYSRIESPSFQTMMMRQNRKLVFVSAETISRQIRAYYDEQRVKAYTYLEKAAEEFSFTTDIWTADSGIPWMSLTVHLITPEFELISALLDIRSIKGTHTGQIIADMFKRMSTGFFGHHRNRIIAITTDNASNNTAFIGTLLDEQVLADPEAHVRCFAHVLNLAAEQAIKPLNRLMEKLRKIVKFIRGSNLQRNAYESLCIECGIKYLVPVVDIPTRWNSAYQMLEYAIKYKEPLMNYIGILIQCRTRSEGVLFTEEHEITRSDFKKYEVYLKFLKPFYVATMETNGEKMTTLSLVIPWYDKLMQHCTLEVERNRSDARLDESDLHDAATYAFQSLVSYYDISSEHSTLACLLDPRLKLEFFWDPNEVDEANKKDRIIKEEQLRKAYDAWKIKYGITTHSPVRAVEPFEDACNPFSHMQKARNAEADELEFYLRGKTLAEMTDDPLKWWKRNQNDFPVLSRMARVYLAIPATSAPSERVFSAAGNLITVKRTALCSESIQAGMTLRSWRRAGLIDRE